jgi:hypothetical protein
MDEIIGEALANLINACLQNPKGAREFIAYFQKEESATGRQTLVQRVTVSTKDPAKATSNWLRDRQYIRRYTESERLVMANGAIERIEQPKSEWRITKSEAYIYRELCKAAEEGEIPLAKAAVSDFMINKLRKKDGDVITRDSLMHAARRSKADKGRQRPTK